MCNPVSVLMVELAHPTISILPANVPRASSEPNAKLKPSKSPKKINKLSSTKITPTFTSNPKKSTTTKSASKFVSPKIKPKNSRILSFSKSKEVQANSNCNPQFTRLPQFLSKERKIAAKHFTLISSRSVKNSTTSTKESFLESPLKTTATQPPTDGSIFCTKPW